MSGFKIQPVPGSKYRSKCPDDQGNVDYTATENSVWRDLLARQIRAIQPVACDAYLLGMEMLQLPKDRIPQLEEVSSQLRSVTGWQVEAVPALIPFYDFCDLLARKKFPCATFIRRREELDYLQEPDIFHEIFGHCAMLTNSYFAEFTRLYGELGCRASDLERRYLERLYWFTVEFGLVKQSVAGVSEQKIYGGGILSSIGETEYAMSDTPEVLDFDLVEVFRTPYRIDIMQPVYFILEDLQQLFEIARMDIKQAIRQAERQGMRQPKFAAPVDAAPVETASVETASALAGTADS